MRTKILSTPAHYSVIALIAAALASQPAAAASLFRFKPLTIDHSRNVDATAINSTDTIVGTYVDGDTGATQGFIHSGHKLTKLPPPSQCGGANPAYPTAINAHGTVTGYCLSEPNADGWVWQHHEYTSGDDFLVGTDGGGVDILENKSGEVAYTANYGFDYTAPFAGPPASPQPVQGLDQDVTVINSLNDRGVLAGTTFLEGPKEVFFVGTSGNIATFVPPGAVAFNGGFINNVGQVAGSYVDSGNLSHGFVYKNGKYTYFELPKGATSVAVTGLNNSGRIVGLLTDSATKMQRIFYYNGANVTVFHHYPAADVLHLALSDNGTLLVSDESPSLTSSSYIGACGGPDC
jgi:hypothetical protein